MPLKIKKWERKEYTVDRTEIINPDLLKDVRDKIEMLRINLWLQEQSSALRKA